MKKIRDFFTRHLIVAPVSFGSWLYLIIGTGMNFFAATGLLIAIYLGGTFSIKQLQMASEVKQLGMRRSEYRYIQDQLKEAKNKLRRLNSYYGKVKSVRAFKQLHEMNLLSRKILNIVQSNPKKFYHVENFFYAHLDSAVQLTSKYAILVNQPLKDQEVKIALQSTRETLTNVHEQLAQDLRQALASDLEQLQLELDFVDATMNKKKPLLTMKGESTHD